MDEDGERSGPAMQRPEINPFGFGEVEPGSTLLGDLFAGISILKDTLGGVRKRVREILPGWHSPALIESWLARLDDAVIELRGSREHSRSAHERKRDVAAMLARRSDTNLPLAAALLRLAVLRQLAALHTDYEELRLKAHAPEFSRSIEQRVLDLGRVLRWAPLRNAQRLRMPQVTDYVSLAAAHEHEPPQPPAERAYDEKFGLLVAPKLFTLDLIWARRECEARGRTLVVAYADIDDFKDLNGELTESIVDRDVLPFFMRGLDAFLFNRGWAYREGGDEYLILLPNVTAKEAKSLLKGLQRHLSSIRYPGTVPRSPTISVGFHLLSAESPETPSQAKAIANLAKNRAKKLPKGRVVAARAIDRKTVLEVAR